MKQMMKTITVCILFITLSISSIIIPESNSNFLLRNPRSIFLDDTPTPPIYCKGYSPETSQVSRPPIQGERPLLLILIEFKDHLHSHNRSYYDQILWDGKPSVRDYYTENSYGHFTYTKAGILGWYTSTLSIDRGDTNLPVLALQAFELARNDRSFNFSRYDGDNDGTVTYDELSIIIGTSGNQFISPTYAYFTDTGVDEQVTWDGVTLPGAYATVQEWFPWHVYAHELGHSLGLPDLYDYPTARVTGNSYGIGPYDIMCMGGGQLSAWSKIRLGWIDPIIIEEDGYYEILASEKNPQAYILQNPSHSSHEYFLVENRWPPDSYDTFFPWQNHEGIPDAGLVIYHIDENRLNTAWGGTARWPNSDNNDESHKIVDIECPDSLSSHFKDADHFDSETNLGDITDLWDKGVYTFHDTSFPCNSRWYNNEKSGVSISVLSSPNETMIAYFSLNGFHLPLNISLNYPEKGHLYIAGREISATLLGGTVIWGPITIAVTGISTTKVEFYIDNQLRLTDTSAPYKYPLTDIIFGRHNIKAVAYDDNGNTACDEIWAWMWNIRFFPLFFRFLFSF